MIEIGRLRLQLPAGFKDRGARISRLVADKIADHPISESITIERLAPRAITLSAGQTDQQLAAAIARAITRGIDNHNTQAVDRLTTHTVSTGGAS